MSFVIAMVSSSISIATFSSMVGVVDIAKCLCSLAKGDLST